MKLNKNSFIIVIGKKMGHFGPYKQINKCWKFHLNISIGCWDICATRTEKTSK